MSVQITSTDPSVSTAGSLLMREFFLLILVTPMERTIATIAASHSGMEATARETERRNISRRFLPCIEAIMNIRIQIAIAHFPSIFPSSSSRFSSGVLVLSSVSRIWAIFPTSVSDPVATTIPSP